MNEICYAVNSAGGIVPVVTGVVTGASILANIIPSTSKVGKLVNKLAINLRVK